MFEFLAQTVIASYNKLVTFLASFNITMSNNKYSFTMLDKKETYGCVSKCMENIISKCSSLPEDKQNLCFIDNIKTDKKAQDCSRECINKYNVANENTGKNNTNQVESTKCVKWTNDHPNVAPHDCVVKDFEIALLGTENTMTIKMLITFIDKLNSCKYLENTSIALFIDSIILLNRAFNYLIEKKTNEHEICDFVNNSQLYQKIKFVSDYLGAINMVCMIGTVDRETFEKLLVYYSDTDIIAKMITIMQLVKKHMHELGKLYVVMESTFAVAQKVCTVRADVLESLKNYNIKLIQIFLNTAEEGSEYDTLFSMDAFFMLVVVLLFLILVLKN